MTRQGGGGNPMDEDFNLRSGFSIVESMIPYSYTGNNPIIYYDSTGYEKQNFTMMMIWYQLPGLSMNNPSTTGIDVIALYTDDGVFYYSGFQGSATRLNEKGKNETVASGSKVTFLLSEDSSKSYGVSFLITGGETEDGRAIDENGVPADSDGKPISLHGNSPKGREGQEYRDSSENEILISEGCGVGHVGTFKELLDKVKSLGGGAGNTWEGEVWDATDMGP